MAELRVAQSATEKRQATTHAKLDAILAKLNIFGFSFGSEGECHDSSSQETESPSAQKMELPGFDGSDARAWLSRVEHYFFVHKVATTKKVELAVIVLSGSAMVWYQLLIRQIPNLDWTTFQRKLLIRYGDNQQLMVMRL